MPRVGFELTISVFEWSKTVRALDSAAIGTVYIYYKIQYYIHMSRHITLYYVMPYIYHTISYIYYIILY